MAAVVVAVVVAMILVVVVVAIVVALLVLVILIVLVNLVQGEGGCLRTRHLRTCKDPWEFPAPPGPFCSNTMCDDHHAVIECEAIVVYPFRAFGFNQMQYVSKSCIISSMQ